MKSQTGYEKFQAAMADWIAGTMNAAAKAKGKRMPDRDDFSPEEIELLNELFHRFTGISHAMDNIELCMRFVGARAPRAKNMQLDSYLKYHITFYIQEVYILKERMKVYATKIQRLRRDRGFPYDKNRYTNAIALVEQALSSIVTVRGSHVHDRPFSDDDMHMLGSLSFLAVQRPDNLEWLQHLRDEYLFVKSIWVKRLAKNREDFDEIMNTFFGFLYGEVFDGCLLPCHEDSSNP